MVGRVVRFEDEVFLKHRDSGKFLYGYDGDYALLDDGSIPSL